MDDREEGGGIGALILDHWRVLKIVTESGFLPLIASEAIGQQMRLGRQVVLQEAPQFGGVGRRQHSDPSASSVEPMLTLDGVSMLAVLGLWRRFLFDREHNQALVRVGGAASGTFWITPAANMAVPERVVYETPRAAVS